MQIFIPSMRRPLIQYTWKALCQETPYRVRIVVPNDEADMYRMCLPEAELLVCPPDIQGISATRQFIMNESDDNRVVMMDDDLSFAVRRHDAPDRFREPMEGEIRNMLIILNGLFDDYAHVSIATREGGNRDTVAIAHCKRVTRVIGYRRNIFLEEKIDFRNSTVMDDFEATLALLTRGYENAILNSYVQNQKGSGTTGGASVYRTMEMHADAAHTLARRYPEYVKTVRKKTKTAWGGKERTDVIIQWKKALNHGRADGGPRLLDN